MSEDEMNQLVEVICEQGCQYVNQVILLLGQQQSSAGLESLNGVEKNTLLQELSSIMAVYGNSCSVPENAKN